MWPEQRRVQLQDRLVDMEQGFIELQQYLFTDVRPTGRKLGVGAYGRVEELEVNGLVCAGKRLHETLLEHDNAGVRNIVRRYQEECQVLSMQCCCNMILVLAMLQLLPLPGTPFYFQIQFACRLWQIYDTLTSSSS